MIEAGLQAPLCAHFDIAAQKMSRAAVACCIFDLDDAFSSINTLCNGTLLLDIVRKANIVTADDCCGVAITNASSDKKATGIRNPIA
jgi:hypothetical protein